MINIYEYLLCTSDTMKMSKTQSLSIKNSKLSGIDQNTESTSFRGINSGMLKELGENREKEEKVKRGRNRKVTAFHSNATSELGIKG